MNNKKNDHIHVKVTATVDSCKSFPVCRRRKPIYDRRAVADAVNSVGPEVLAAIDAFDSHCADMPIVTVPVGPT